MKRLPYGVTGFHYYLDTPPPVTDERAFIALCHTFAQLVEAKITSTKRLGSVPERNFTAVEFQSQTEGFAILLNAHYPLIAFSKPIQYESLTLEFIDRPEYEWRWLQLGDFRVLHVKELSASPYDLDVSEISDTEYDQILVRQPRSMGGIVFNFWD